MGKYNEDKQEHSSTKIGNLVVVDMAQIIEHRFNVCMALVYMCKDPCYCIGP